MSLGKGRRAFSLNYLFSSFFGALMIAGAFAYYNYKFSEYKFFDFNAHQFYTSNDIFTPTDDFYRVIIYSSKQENIKNIVSKLRKQDSILAIDLYQKRFKEEDSIINISTGMNTLLKLIQRFNVYEIPCVFELERVKNQLYKQKTAIEIIE